MAIIGEEFGFIGILIVILLLGLIFSCNENWTRILMLGTTFFRGFFALGIGFGFSFKAL